MMHNSNNKDNNNNSTVSTMDLIKAKVFSAKKYF